MAAVSQPALPPVLETRQEQHHINPVDTLVGFKISPYSWGPNLSIAFNFKGVDFAIDEILNADPEGIKVMDKYFGKKVPVDCSARRLIVKVLVIYLTNRIGHLYPSSEMKEELASKIVKTFPVMVLKREGVSAHSYLFDKKSSNGYIDVRLKSMRTAAGVRKREASSKSTKKPEKKSRNVGTPLDHEDFDEEDAKRKVPTRSI